MAVCGWTCLFGSKKTLRRRVKKKGGKVSRNRREESVSENLQPRLAWPCDRTQLRCGNLSDWFLPFSLLVAVENLPSEEKKAKQPPCCVDERFDDQRGKCSSLFAAAHFYSDRGEISFPREGVCSELRERRCGSQKRGDREGGLNNEPDFRKEEKHLATSIPPSNFLSFSLSCTLATSIHPLSPLQSIAHSPRSLERRRKVTRPKEGSIRKMTSPIAIEAPEAAPLMFTPVKQVKGNARKDM